MKQEMRRRMLGMLLLAVVIATATAGSAMAAEWHRTNTYTFNEDVGQIGIWVADWNLVAIELDNSNSDLVKIVAWSGDREILGIGKETECHRTLYQTSPYRALPVGKQLNPDDEELDTIQEVIAAETLVQFYWTNHKGPSWWQFDTDIMDRTAEMWNYAVQYRITTGSSSMVVEEWRNY